MKVLELLKGLGIIRSECKVCGKEGGFKGQAYICQACLESIKPHHPIEYKRIDYLFSYRVFGLYDGVLKEVITSIKFELNIPLARRLGSMIAPHLWSYIQEVDAHYVSYPPLNYRRMWTRGFNQVRLILESAGITPMELFTRRGFSKPMASLDAKQRQRAIMEYELKSRTLDLIEGKRILIVDDVLTTGSTASRLAKLLLSVGAEEVHAFFIAKSG